MQNIGIILYTQGNNYKNLTKCLESLSEFKDNILVVCDGQLPSLKILDDHNCVDFRRTDHFAGCVNHGLRHFIKTDVDHIFIVNDNIMVLDPAVFDDFIKVNNYTNLDFIVDGNSDKKRLTVELKDDYNITLVSEFDGYVCYLNKNTVRKVGFFDERYKTTFELLDYYKRAADAGVTTPFGWFATVGGMDTNIYNQTNSPDFEHKQFSKDGVEDRIIRGMKVFKLKFKAMVNELTNIFSQKDVVNKMKNIASRK